MGAATASSLLAKRAAAADTASDQPLVPWCGQWFELEGVVVVVDVVAVVAFDEDVFVLPRPAAIAAPAPVSPSAATAETSARPRFGRNMRDLLSVGVRSIEPTANKSSRRCS